MSVTTRDDTARHRLDQRVAAALVMAAADEDVGGAVVRGISSCGTGPEHHPIVARVTKRFAARPDRGAPRVHPARRRDDHPQCAAGNAGRTCSSAASTVNGSLFRSSRPTQRSDGVPDTPLWRRAWRRSIATKSVLASGISKIGVCFSSPTVYHGAASSRAVKVHASASAKAWRHAAARTRRSGHHDDRGTRPEWSCRTMAHASRPCRRISRTIPGNINPLT